MRPIRIARLEKSRPAVVLTREAALGALTWLTVAPITSTVRGLATEVPVGIANGVGHASVISCDNIQTVPAGNLGRTVGFLLEQQESLLAAAIASAFDLRVEELG